MTARQLTTALLTAMLTMAAAPSLHAQTDIEPIMELKPDKKTIYTDRLGLPPNASLADAIQLLPELTVKGSSGLTDNYSLTVDGHSYDLDIETYLSRTLLGDVEKIEVVTNGIADGTPGVVGAIKITTKKVSEGTDAGADISVNTKGSVMPSAYVIWKKGRWSTGAQVMTGWQRSRTTTETFDISSSELSINDTRSKPFAETFQWRGQYDNGQDKVELKVFQTYTRSIEDIKYDTRNAQDMQLLSKQYDDNDAKSHDLTTILTWDHIFNAKHKLQLEGAYEYQYTPYEKWDQNTYDANGVADELKWGVISNWSKSKQLSATAKYTANFAPWVEMIVGGGYNKKWGHNDTEALQNDRTLMGKIIETADSFSIYATNENAEGYMQLTFTPVRNLSLMIGQRGKYTRYTMQGRQTWQDVDFNNEMKTWQTSAMLNYQVSHAHSLMAAFNRRMMTPGISQMLPSYYLESNASKRVYYYGNTDLTSPTYNIFDLGYAYNQGPWAAAATIRYYSNDNVISMEQIGSAYITRPTEYYRFSNCKKQHVMSNNLMGSWHNKVVSVLGAFNYQYSELQESAGGNWSHNNTWSARLMANVIVGNGWYAAASAMYISGAVNDYTETEGEWFGAISLSKKWNHLTAMLRWENMLEQTIYTRSKTSANFSCTQAHNHYLRLTLSWRL